MSERESAAESRLNALLVSAGQAPLGTELLKRFADYLSLILRWNARMNLTGIRDEEDILSRHFVESIACARAIPQGIATLLDFGSGAGFPGIPISICRPEIAVTLSESQGKKAAFLREAVRTLNLAATVHAERAETLKGNFDCVALRGVDRMSDAVGAAAALAVPEGWLCIMTSRSLLAAMQAAAGTTFHWADSIPLLGSEERVLALGQRSS